MFPHVVILSSDIEPLLIQNLRQKYVLNSLSCKCHTCICFPRIAFLHTVYDMDRYIYNIYIYIIYIYIYHIYIYIYHIYIYIHISYIYIHISYIYIHMCVCVSLEFPTGLPEEWGNPEMAHREGLWCLTRAQNLQIPTCWADDHDHPEIELGVIKLSPFS